MLIKVITTALVLIGLAMLVGLPFLFAQRPAPDDQQELATFGAWMLAYFGVTCLVWLSAAFSAVFVMRAIKTKLVEEQKENMKGMVEGTLQDHGRKE